MRRIAIYSHDTLGLGHLRRCLKLADHLRAQFGALRGLLLTGSPWHGLFPLPDGFGVEPLPPVAKAPDGRYACRARGVDLSTVIGARRARISARLDAFRPELFVVDNVPCGLHGEVLPALRALRRRGTRTVLALRDVLDDPTTICREWVRAGAIDAVAQLFDEIWVFGDAADTEALMAEGPLAGVASKVISCGRIGVAGRDREPSRVVADQRADRPLVLVTGGGGQDAEPLMRAYLSAVHAFRPAVDSHLVLGPDFPRRDRQSLPPTGDAPLRVTGFVPDLPERMARSNVVVSMAGYNTVCEILASGRPAVLVPRVTPRQEQLIRARRWSRRGRTRMIDPRRLTPEGLWEAVGELLALPSVGAPSLGEIGLHGGRVAARRAAALLGAPVGAAS
jgi:predicted glycosyltransferase